MDYYDSDDSEHRYHDWDDYDDSDDEDSDDSEVFHYRPRVEESPPKRQRINPPSPVQEPTAPKEGEERLELPHIDENTIKTYSEANAHDWARRYFRSTRSLYYKHENKLTSTVTAETNEKATVEILFFNNRVTNTKCSEQRCQNGVLWCCHVCCALLSMLKTPGNVTEYGALCRGVFERSKEDLASAIVRLMTENHSIIYRFTSEFKHYEKQELKHIFPPEECEAPPIENFDELLDILPASGVIQTHSINTREIEESIYRTISFGTLSYHATDVIRRHLQTVEKLVAINDLYNALDIVEKIGTICVQVEKVDRYVREFSTVIAQMNDILMKTVDTLDEHKRKHWNDLLETWCSSMDLLGIKPSFQETIDCLKTSWDDERLLLIFSGDADAAVGFTEGRKVIRMRLERLQAQKAYESAFHYAKAVGRHKFAAAALVVQEKFTEALNYVLENLQRCSDATVIMQCIINQKTDPVKNNELMIQLIDKFENQDQITQDKDISNILLIDFVSRYNYSTAQITEKVDAEMINTLLVYGLKFTTSLQKEEKTMQGVLDSSRFIRSIMMKCLPAVLKELGETEEISNVIRYVATYETSQSQTIELFKILKEGNIDTAMKYGAEILTNSKSRELTEEITSIALSNKEKYGDVLLSLVKALQNLEYNRSITTEFLKKIVVQLLESNMQDICKGAVVVYIQHKIYDATHGTITKEDFDYIVQLAVKLDILPDLVTVLVKAVSTNGDSTYYAKHEPFIQSNVVMIPYNNYHQREYVLTNPERIVPNEYILELSQLLTQKGLHHLAFPLIELRTRIFAVKAIPTITVNKLENCKCKRCTEVLDFMQSSERSKTFKRFSMNDITHVGANVAGITGLVCSGRQCFKTHDYKPVDFKTETKNFNDYQTTIKEMIQNIFILAYQLHKNDEQWIITLAHDTAKVRNRMFAEELLKYLLTYSETRKLALQVGADLIERNCTLEPKIQLFLDMAKQDKDVESERKYRKLILKLNPSVDAFLDCKALYSAEEWKTESTTDHYKYFLLTLKPIDRDKLKMHALFEEKNYAAAHDMVMKPQISYANAFIELELMRRCGMTNQHIESTFAKDYMTMIEESGKNNFEYLSKLVLLLADGCISTAFKMTQRKTHLMSDKIQAKPKEYEALQTWLRVAVQVYHKAKKVENGEWDTVVAAIKKDNSTRHKLVSMISETDLNPPFKRPPPKPVQTPRQTPPKPVQQARPVQAMPRQPPQPVFVQSRPHPVPPQPVQVQANSDRVQQIYVSHLNYVLQVCTTTERTAVQMLLSESKASPQDTFKYRQFDTYAKGLMQKYPMPV
jgi:hypothetical protein